MPLPRSRTELKEFALRKLGHPVIQINIAAEQMDDRLDEAINEFQFHHFDAVERTYFKHKVTLSRVILDAPIAQQFELKEVIVGQTSGNNARVFKHTITDDFVEILFLDGEEKTFTAGETITGLSSGTTAIVDEVILGDIDNGYITLPENILSVAKVLPLSFRSKDILFDVRYRIAVSSIPDLMSFDLVGYDAFHKHLALLDFMLKPQAGMNFNKFSGRLYINFDWDNELNYDEYVVIDAEAILDLDEFTRMYQEEWLYNYVVALFREQWAQNLSKYENIQLPGGTTLNVSEMRSKAERDIEKLKEDLIKKYQRPARPMIG